MTSIFDRLEKEIGDLGRKAQEALEEGKLQIELLRLNRERDGVARDLGLVAWRRARGEAVTEERLLAYYDLLDDLARQVAEVEAKLGRAAPAAEPAPSTSAAASDSAPAAPSSGSSEAPPAHG